MVYKSHIFSVLYQNEVLQTIKFHGNRLANRLHFLWSLIDEVAVNQMKINLKLISPKPQSLPMLTKLTRRLLMHCCKPLWMHITIIKATTGGLWSLSPPISQTLWHWSNSIQNLRECMVVVIHSHRFVIALLHWRKVCELGGDRLHRPPVVALKMELSLKTGTDSKRQVRATFKTKPFWAPVRKIRCACTEGPKTYLRA